MKEGSSDKRHSQDIRVKKLRSELSYNTDLQEVEGLPEGVTALHNNLGGITEISERDEDRSLKEDSKSDFFK